jgi:hypothetical protein
MTDNQRTPSRKRVSNRMIALGLAAVALAAYVAIALRIKFGAL